MILKKILSIVCILTFARVLNAQNKFINPENHKIISTDRSDGRYVSTRGLIQYKMRHQQPILAFDQNFTESEVKVWKTRVATKLRELMKFPTVPPQPSPKLINKKDRVGYTVEKWEIYTQPGSVVPILMLIPDGVSKDSPAPAVLCFPGSTASKESMAGEPEIDSDFKKTTHLDKRGMAKFYAQQGIVSIAIDNPGIGETSDLEKFGMAPSYDRKTISRILIDMGWNYMGLSSFQGDRVLNWMRSLDFIDKSKIALSGHSLGTEPAMVLAVLNPDIQALVFNDFLTSVIRRMRVNTKPNKKGKRPGTNGLYHSVPGLWKWFDYPDLLASLAPRSLIITEGGVTKDLNVVKDAYQIMEADSSFSLHYYPKYSESQDRFKGEIPEGLSGIASDEWFRYANVDAPNHYFKADLAVPWLKKVLKSK